MPTKREQHYYRLGFRDGVDYNREVSGSISTSPVSTREIELYGQPRAKMYPYDQPKPKRKLSDWQKFVKANSKKRIFKYRDGKLNLKKMGVAYRKTAAYKRNKKK